MRRTKRVTIALRPVHHWILWSIDNREPFKVSGKRGRYLYVGGVVTRVDPKKKRPFSYIAWTTVSCASPWTYDRKEAQTFSSLEAARLMRRFVWLEWGHRHARPRDGYAITRVTKWVRVRGTGTNSAPETKGKGG